MALGKLVSSLLFAGSTFFSGCVSLITEEDIPVVEVKEEKVGKINYGFVSWHEAMKLVKNVQQAIDYAHRHIRYDGGIERVYYSPFFAMGRRLQVLSISMKKNVEIVLIGL